MLSVVLGCGGDDRVAVPTCDQPSPIEDGIYFGVAGRYVPEQDGTRLNVSLGMTTKKYYPSTPYVLETRVSTGFRYMRIDLLGVDGAGAMFWATGPATAKVSYEPMMLPQTILIDIVNGCDTDQYKMMVTTESITLTALKVAFSEVLYDLCWIAPKYSFACYCSIEGQTGGCTCEDFIEYLRGYTRIEERSFPSEGWSPYFGGQYYLHPAPFSPQLEPLFADYSRLLNEESNRTVNMSLSTWEGYYYTSWTYE